MNSTLNKLKIFVNQYLPLPTSGDFELEKKKRICNDIFNSLDNDWVRQESVGFQQVAPFVDIRQNQQRYARYVHRAMEFLKDCEAGGYTRYQIDPTEDRLEAFFRRNKWDIKDFKKVNILMTLAIGF